MTDALRKRLLDSSFKYTKAGETDIAATFRRIRKQMKEQAATQTNVKPLRKVTK